MGISDSSTGAFIHELQLWIMSSLPISMFYNKKKMKEYIDGVREEQKKAEADEKL